MDNQRIVSRAALGFKDGKNGTGIQGVSPKAINGFRRKGYQLTGAERSIVSDGADQNRHGGTAHAEAVGDGSGCRQCRAGSDDKDQNRIFLDQAIGQDRKFTLFFHYCAPPIAAY